MYLFLKGCVWEKIVEEEIYCARLARLNRTFFLQNSHFWKLYVYKYIYSFMYYFIYIFYKYISDLRERLVKSNVEGKEDSVDMLELNWRGLPDPSWIQQTHQHKFGPYSYNLLLIREILATFESVDPRLGLWNFNYSWRLSPQGLKHSIALDVSSIYLSWLNASTRFFRTFI